MPYYCAACSGRLWWCTHCKVKHCTCRPHVRRHYPKDYDRQIVVIRKRVGGTRTMAARRYAHLKGAQKGGQTTAGRPNPGRFNSEAARKASLARWNGRHRLNRPTGLRLGMIRKKTSQQVSRAHLRYLYSRTPRLGIRYYPPEQGETGFWTQTDENVESQIAERTALRRLGHLAYARRNWVPAEDEPIVATTVGINRASRKRRRNNGAI